MYVLQSLQGHLSVVQNFIFSLNIPIEFAFLMSLGINSLILGANEDRLSVQKYTVRFLCLISQIACFLKSGNYLSWFQVLNVARICRFFWCMFTNLPLFSNSSKEILLFRVLLLNIQKRGQEENGDVIKAFIKTHCFLCPCNCILSQERGTFYLPFFKVCSHDNQN